MDRKGNGLQILYCKVGGAGCIAYAAGICAVADINDLVETFVELVKEGEIGTNSERENNCV